jgi:hypothetical protein
MRELSGTFRRRQRGALAAALLAAAAGCAGAAPAPEVGSATHPHEQRDPRDAFFVALSALCGQRFAGRTLYMIEPAPPFDGARLEIHVETCTEREIRIPLAVGEDRSRTWVLVRSAEGLLLEHDHRMADGRPDEITAYGGLAASGGTAERQRFPAHEATARMIPEAATNVWSLELDAGGRRFIYHLERHGAPRFTAEFALEPVAE